jgi:hypothetical protein
VPRDAVGKPVGRRRGAAGTIKVDARVRGHDASVESAAMPGPRGGVLRATRRVCACGRIAG